MVSTSETPTANPLRNQDAGIIAVNVHHVEQVNHLFNTGLLTFDRPSPFVPVDLLLPTPGSALNGPDPAGKGEDKDN